MAGDSANQLLKPQNLTVKDQDGNERNYIISRFPATVGREMLCQYPITALPKVGDYPANEGLMLKLMSYVAVPTKMGVGAPLRLTTQALVNNHVPDGETLMTIEKEMLTYNTSFFLRGKTLTFFDAIMQNVTKKIIETLTVSLQQSSTLAKPPSKN